jgi:3-dehydroquinate dehydratase II
MAQILLLHGANLNLLGTREPTIYGATTLTQINEQLATKAHQQGYTLDCLQSNHEGVLIDRIQAAAHDGTQYIIINPAAFTHTSVAMRDAILAIKIPFIEVHLSNVHARETFRHHSYFSDVAIGVICGLGAQGYDFALQYVLHALTNSNTQHK